MECPCARARAKRARHRASPMRNRRREPSLSLRCTRREPALSTSGTLHHRSGRVHAAREELHVETPCRAVIGRQFAPPAKRFRRDLGEAPADQIAADAGSLLYDGFGKAQAARARRGAPLRFYNFGLTPTPVTNPVQRGWGVPSAAVNWCP